MRMNVFLSQAQAIVDELVANRRTLHRFAETGFDLPLTTAFVKARLAEMGLEPQDVGKAGVSCLIGDPTKGKTILLRCDMDALPMPEQSGLSFAAENGHCHSCGHDFHTAMLLGAARLLKTREAELGGAVKLAFQPAEEILAGATDLVANGILENPTVDAALALHMAIGTEHAELGKVYYAKGPAAFSGDAVKIEIFGRDAHGSKAETGVDAINVAAHVVIALQEIISREISCRDNSVILVGKINGGTTCNTVAGKAELEVSVRTTTAEKRAFLKQRIKEVAQGVAATFRATTEVTYVYGIAPMVTDVALSEQLALYAGAVVGAENTIFAPPNTGTEDFSAFSERVPSAYFTIGSGSIAQGYTLTLHNPQILLDEKCLPTGAAVYAGCALGFLQPEMP
ncbi:MAG TPA: M20 family metallopeptidase [Clostridia bacterium]|nr:M20 family metallopeptidase [Clostridia bacterium]